MFAKNKRSAPKTTLITHHGQIQHSFLSPEFLDYRRGPVWYVLMVATLLLAVSLGVLTHAIMLTLALLLFVGVYWLIHNQPARLIDSAITANGIRYGDKFFAFGEIKEYWIVYRPPMVAELKLHLNQKLSPIVTIYIFGQDPLVIRKLIGSHIKEVRRNETFVDLLIRALRI